MENEEMTLTAIKAYDSAKSAHKRLDMLEKEVSDIHELTASMAAINTKVNTLASDMGEIKTEVQKIAERPSKWWDKLIAAGIGAVASGLVAALLAQVLR